IPHRMSGSSADKDRIQNNQDLLNKLDYINILAYAFLRVDENGNIYLDNPKINLSENLHKPDLSKYSNNFDAFSKLNNKHHNLKKIISIGGGADRTSFINTLKHPQNFIESAYTIIKAYKLDGIDLDFELDSVFTKDQAKKYAQLVQALRKKLG